MAEFDENTGNILQIVHLTKRDRDNSLELVPERTWIDLAALVIGGVVAWLVLRVGKDRGIGPQIRMTLALALICPVVLILGLEKVLSGETIAAIVGALVGSGVPTSGATPPSASR